MTIRWVSRTLGVAGAWGLANLASFALAEDSPADLTRILERSCIECHGQDGKVKGELDLLELGSETRLRHEPEWVEAMIAVLDQREMPPEKADPLPEADRRRLLSVLDSLRREIADAAPRGRTPIRRMNRFQYANAVEDLFELSVEVFALPERMVREHRNYFQPASGRMPETVVAGSRPLGKSQLIGRRLAGVAPFPQDLRAEHGFDNRADHLTLSPLLLESFLKLSRSIVESPDFNARTCGIWESFFAEPDEPEAAVIEARVGHFLNCAFRREVSAGLRDRYVSLAQESLAEGAGFETAMKSVASAALASPRFLYLYGSERQEGENARAAEQWDLASRLSFFLWGSVPDEGLRGRAARGELGDPDVLAAEVERLLNDRRVKRFCDSFPSQWLQLERIVASVPNRERFPEFYFAKFRVSMHMMLEPLLLFETVLVEDRSVIELLDSDYSYRSELLSAWYETGTLPKRRPPTAIPFQRVPVTDPRQGGAITTAAVMTMTSGPKETQPITRGAWMAGVLFNDPPEPPPADVPPLEDTVADAEDAPVSLRERFATHRERADCAGCHVKIDPLGFALEEYGPTGRWRAAYDNGAAIDASGVLFGRHAFTDAVSFKEALLVEKDRFVRGFTEHLLSFALARELVPADSVAVDRIVEAAATDGYRLRALLKHIVLSPPFRQIEAE